MGVWVLFTILQNSLYQGSLYQGLNVSGMHCAWLHWGIDKQTESLESFLEKIGSNKSTHLSQLRYWIGTFFSRQTQLQ